MASATAFAVAPTTIDDDTDTDGFDAHSLFARDALNHRLLSADEERELARRYREERDLAARERLITHNLRLVYAVAARNWPAHHLSRLDLVQEGTIGLMHAIEKFDERKGWQLSTYASYWIRQAIGRAIMDRDDAIPLPAHMHEVRTQMRRAESTLAAQTGREPSAAEVRLAAGVTGSRDLVARLAAAEQTRHVASLDVELGGAAHAQDGTELRTLADTIPDPAAADGDTLAERLAEEDTRAGLWRLCRSVLTPRQAQVLELRFGLGSVGGDRITDGMWSSVPLGKLQQGGGQMSTAGAVHTMEEVGRMLGICRERVRQLEAQALRTLRERLTRDDGSGAVTVAGLHRQRSIIAAAAPTPAPTAAGDKADGASETRWRVWALLNANPNATIREVAAAAGDAISLRGAGALIRAWRAERDAAAAAASRYETVTAVPAMRAGAA